MNTEEFSKYLEPVFEFKRRRAQEMAGQAKESLARVQARVQERLATGDLPEELDVDCRTTQPYLPAMADPLELERPPRWLCEHVALCRSCQGKLDRLEELHHVIVVAEMPASVQQEVLAEAAPEFAEKVHKLQAIKPEDITCDQVGSYYLNMATYNPERRVPAEIYRHTRHCASCKDQVQQLRAELIVAIPQAGTPEFEKLLVEKSELHIVPAAEKDRRHVPARVGVFLQNNWRKLTIGAAAAAVIVGFLIISPGRAMAITFEQVCQAFAKIQFIHMTVQPQSSQFVRISTPQYETWYSREPLVKITLDSEGVYTRFTAANGIFVKYGPNGVLQSSKQYSGQELQEIIGTFQRDLDFRQNLGLANSDELRWTMLKENITIDGRTADIYELAVNVKKHDTSEQKKFRVYIDKSTALPIRAERYKQQWQSREWMLISAAEFSYPSEIPEDILNPQFAKGG